MPTLPQGTAWTVVFASKSVLPSTLTSNNTVNYFRQVVHQTTTLAFGTKQQYKKGKSFRDRSVVIEGVDVFNKVKVYHFMAMTLSPEDPKSP